MWRPGFAFVRASQARLDGFRRALCVYSVVHRGSYDWPGLVLGLDGGGSCRGIAFQISPDHWDDTLRYLRSREQVTGVYRELTHRAVLLDGTHRPIRALTFAVDRSHPQYTGKLPLAVQARLVAQGVGLSGCNLEYVLNTLARLRGLNCRDRPLEQLVQRLGVHHLRACASACDRVRLLEARTAHIRRRFGASDLLRRDLTMRLRALRRPAKTAR